MKRNVLLSILVLLTSVAFGQLKSKVDSIYNVIKESGIHSKSANWVVIESSWKE